MCRHTNGLNIQFPSDLFALSHITAETRPADEQVAAVIEEKRENIATADVTYRAAMKSTVVKENINIYMYVDERNTVLENKAKSRLSQGEWASLFKLQNPNIKFKTLVKGVSETTYRWMLKAITDTCTLPTNNYLNRIHQTISPVCALCGHIPETLLHVLNNCPVSPRQQRYTWQHNHVLSCLHENLLKHQPAHVETFVDLGTEDNSATIPMDILLTNQRPDLSTVNRTTRRITLVELTVCWDLIHAATKTRKEQRYE